MHFTNFALIIINKYSVLINKKHHKHDNIFRPHGRQLCRYIFSFCYIQYIRVAALKNSL